MQLARSLFDDDVHVAEGDPATVPFVLLPAEEAQISRAVEKRVREFGVARALYRSLLPGLGLPESALVNDADRAPIWPEAIVGTITHTSGYCAVALAASRDVLGLGVDAEVAGPLKRALWKTICTAGELEALERMHEHEAGMLAKLTFSAKECAYKAQYARTRTFLGFAAMRIDVDRARQRFVATFEKDAGEIYAPGDVIDGRYLETETHVITGVTIRR